MISVVRLDLPFCPERLLLIMSFTEKSGVIGCLYRVKGLYGKATEAHLKNEENRVRADNLLK